MNAQNLQKGSIVRMAFSTYANNVKPEWEVVKTYMIEGTQMATYIADCIVCNVTPKFFQVIIPHRQCKSVRYSKDCFDTTKQSYADARGIKPVIVKI